ALRFGTGGCGWREAFLTAGGAPAVVAWVGAAYASDRPEQPPAVNDAERELIHKDDPHLAVTREQAAGSWLDLLRNRSLVFLTASYAAIGYFEYLFFFWMNYYFEHVLHIDERVRQFYSPIPILAMAGGMALGGWLSDRLVQAYGYRLGRAAVPVGGMLAGAALLVLGAFATEPVWIVTLFSLALGAVGATEGPFWMTA